MLVIISDLHFTDGSSGTTISDGAFRVFRQRLRDLAYDASWRLKKKQGVREDAGEEYVYEPIDSFDIILLGDIFDVIRSKSWGFQKNAIRPWDYGTSATASKKVAAKVSGITADILKHNSESFDILKSLTRPSENHAKSLSITLPPAKDGKPDSTVDWAPWAEGRQPVKVRIHYMVGNHDWFYHAPDAGFVAIRRKIQNALGLVNDPAQPFPHEPEESTAISQVLADHDVYARHGDIYDSFNFEGERDASSLGDAIVIELLNRFPLEVAARLEKDLDGVPPGVVKGLKEIDNVRPLLLAPVWIDGLLRRLCKDHKQIKQVKKVWNDLVHKFLKIPFIKDRNSWLNPWDNVDQLRTALILSSGLSLHTASRLLQWINDKGIKRPDSYYREALTEPKFKNLTAKYIVYGHTHHHQLTPLDVSYPPPGELKQLYLNSGTWRRVHGLAKLNTKDEEFVGYDVMTYLTFFKDDERCGRSFEVWSGSLAPLR